MSRFSIAIGCVLILLSMMLESNVHSQMKVAEYPEVLRFQNGNAVTRGSWEQRRQELVELFRSNVYGRRPDLNQIAVSFHQVHSEDDGMALGGIAIRRQIRIQLVSKLNSKKKMELDLLVYLPRDRVNENKKFPIMLGLNFEGNHTIRNDAAVRIIRYSNEKGEVKPSPRGKKRNRWPVDLAIQNGFGVATICYNQIDPDFDDGFGNGVHSLLGWSNSSVKADERWGSISTWAWGLSLAMDYLVTDEWVDSKKVAVFGHSRLGKTALWAGATDPRFAVVISNNSGCGGAAVSRRAHGETIERITTVFPHWFCRKLSGYGKKVPELPVDQHQLIAAIAPRAVYVASASKDDWADPVGEFMSLQLGKPAFDLFGLKTEGVEKMPEYNRSVGGILGYHIREGRHDIKRFDWECYLAFCKRLFD